MIVEREMLVNIRIAVIDEDDVGRSKWYIRLGGTSCKEDYQGTIYEANPYFREHLELLASEAVEKDKRAQAAYKGWKTRRAVKKKKEAK